MPQYPPMVDDKLLPLRQNAAFLGYCNVLYSLLYSGFGLCEALHPQKNTEAKSIDKKESKMEDHYIPLLCTYQRAKPSYHRTEHSSNYQWNSASFDASISVETQALAILCLCKASTNRNCVSEEERRMLMNTALSFYQFTVSLLRNEQGLYVNKTNHASEPSIQIKLKTDKKEKEPILYHHILMLEATAALLKLLQSTQIKHTSKTKHLLLQEDFYCLLDYVLSQEFELIEQDSADLTLSLLSLCRCLDILPEDCRVTQLSPIITRLSLELEARVCITGEVQKSDGSKRASSVAAHARAYTSLRNVQTKDMLMHRDSSLASIHSWLEDLFDEHHGLYHNLGNSCFKYGIQDIADLLYYLLKRYGETQNPAELSRLYFFYARTLEEIPIVQGMDSISIESARHSPTEGIPIELQASSKPIVFLKKFILNPLKNGNGSLKVSSHYSSSQALYASYIFMYYFHDDI